MTADTLTKKFLSRNLFVTFNQALPNTPSLSASLINLAIDSSYHHYHPQHHYCHRHDCNPHHPHHKVTIVVNAQGRTSRFHSFKVDLSSNR